jgi:hypothetical protein
MDLQKSLFVKITCFKGSTALQAGRLRVRFQMVSLKFFIDIVLVLLAALWSQGLREMNSRNISWGGGRGGWCVELTNLPPSCTDCPQNWEPQPFQILMVVQDLFTFNLPETYRRIRQQFFVCQIAIIN